MAYQYHIDSDLKCVFVRHFGEMEVDEVRLQLEELIQDPAYGPNTK